MVALGLGIILFLESINQVEDLATPLPKVILVADHYVASLLAEDAREVELTLLVLTVFGIYFAQLEVGPEFFFYFSLI